MGTECFNIRTYMRYSEGEGVRAKQGEAQTCTCPYKESSPSARLLLHYGQRDNRETNTGCGEGDSQWLVGTPSRGHPPSPLVSYLQERERHTHGSTLRTIAYRATTHAWAIGDSKTAD